MIETVARAMTAARGHDPDEMVPVSDHPIDKNNLIPRWVFDRELARKHIAASWPAITGSGNPEIGDYAAGLRRD